MDLVTEILPTSQGLDGLRIYGADCLVLARLFILILVVLPLCHSGNGHGVMVAEAGGVSEVCRTFLQREIIEVHLKTINDTNHVASMDFCINYSVLVEDLLSSKP